MLLASVSWRHCPWAPTLSLVSQMSPFLAVKTPRVFFTLPVQGQPLARRCRTRTPGGLPRQGPSQGSTGARTGAEGKGSSSRRGSWETTHQSAQAKFHGGDPPSPPHTLSVALMMVFQFSLKLHVPHGLETRCVESP